MSHLGASLRLSPLQIGEEKSTSAEYQSLSGHRLTLDRAHTLMSAYQERADVLADLKGSADATYGWHSLEFYEDYIKFLKKTSKKAGIKVSGIRMYYAASPENDDSEHAGYQTYMYVPTYFDIEKQAHIAFDPLYIGEDGTPIPLHDILINGTQKYMNTNLRINDAVGSVTNFAAMCEPIITDPKYFSVVCVLTDHYFYNLIIALLSFLFPGLCIHLPFHFPQ